MTHALNLGKKGEALVAHYLKKQGFIIRATNYTQRCGEIDIIAQKKEILAFVEVKLRQYKYFSISEVIVPSKRNKIIKTARFYIAENNLTHNVIYRFDVALLEPIGLDYTITYIPNAFTQERNF